MLLSVSAQSFADFFLAAALTKFLLAMRTPRSIQAKNPYDARSELGVWLYGEKLRLTQFYYEICTMN